MKKEFKEKKIVPAISVLFFIAFLSILITWLIVDRESKMWMLAVVNLLNAIVWHPKSQLYFQQRKLNREKTLL